MSTGADDVAALLESAREHVAALEADEAAAGAADATEIHAELTGLLSRALTRLTGLAETAPSGGELRAGLEAAGELQRLAARVAHDHVLAGVRAQAAVDAALARLADLGPPSQLVAQGAAEAAGAVDLDRVVLSRVDEGRLVAEAVHVAGDAAQADATLQALRDDPVRLDYPLLDVEVVCRRRPLLVADARADPRGRSAHAERLGWRAYVVAPVVLDGAAVGVFHADRGISERGVSALDRDALGRYAAGYATALERAVLRRRLQTQRQQLRTVASWAESRTSELSDRAISLVTDRDDDHTDAARRSDAGPAVADLLTPREIDVLEQMADGHTNAAIARSLVVSEGTVKFHVKNILRKMHATNRAEATSQYLRMKLR